jgi:hypothetical protein
VSTAPYVPIRVDEFETVKVAPSSSAGGFIELLRKSRLEQMTEDRQGGAYTIRCAP